MCSALGEGGIISKWGCSVHWWDINSVLAGDQQCIGVVQYIGEISSVHQGYIISALGDIISAFGGGGGGLSRKFKFGQKSDMHSKCTNMKIHTQPATLVNCQKIIDSY